MDPITLPESRRMPMAAKGEFVGDPYLRGHGPVGAGFAMELTPLTEGGSTGRCRMAPMSIRSQISAPHQRDYQQCRSLKGIGPFQFGESREVSIRGH